MCYYKQNRLDTVNLIITKHSKTIFNKYGFIKSCLCMLCLQLSQVHWLCLLRMAQGGSSDPDQHAVTDDCLRTDISELRGHSNIT